MNRNDPLYDDLFKRGPEDIDAWHVFVAAKNGCHAFLTYHYAAAIRQICGLVVQKPSDFVANAGWRRGPALIACPRSTIASCESLASALRAGLKMLAVAPATICSGGITVSCGHS